VNEKDEAVMIFADVNKHIAQRTVISNDVEVKDPSANYNKKKEGAKKIPISAIEDMNSLLGDLQMLSEILSTGYKSKRDINDMEQRASRFKYFYLEIELPFLEKMLHGTCAYGDQQRYSVQEILEYMERIDALKAQSDDLLNKMENFSDSYATDMLRKLAWMLGTSALDVATGGATGNVSQYAELFQSANKPFIDDDVNDKSNKYL
jgi:hypothetical protein